MIEVFKTNVERQHEANMLVTEIGNTFAGWVANFDLSDCDKILRVKCSGVMNSAELIKFLENFGYSAEVLQE